MGSERGPDRDEDGDDPFEGLTLDESFVRSAAITEPSAADRARAERQANLSRLLSDEAAQRENVAYERRRYAAGGGFGSPDELDDWDVAAARRRRRRPVRVVALIVLVAVVAVYVVSDYLRSADTSPERSAPDGTSELSSAAPPSPEDMSDLTTSTAVVTEGEPGDAGEPTVLRPDGWPPLDPDVSSVPLGRPGTVPAGGGPHSFVLTQTDDRTPVGYDPCRPVRFRTRPGGPAAGPQLIGEAVAMVSAATGLQFVDEGATDEAPSDDREAYQPERYGEKWAPVLIAWSDVEESPQLGQVVEEAPDADVAGYAGSQPVGMSSTNRATGETTETGLVFVTGTVVLDGPDLSAMLGLPGGHERARAIIAHELAHLVGLGHVDDPSQLMNPQTTAGVHTFGAGDLQGLAALGSLECFPEI